jgi:hypothetical protein
MRELKPAALIGASMLWFYGFGIVISSKSSPFSGSTELVVSILLLAAPVVMPLLGFFLLKGQPRDLWYKSVLFPAFLVSLLPATISLCAVGVLLFVPAPKG